MAELAAARLAGKDVPTEYEFDGIHKDGHLITLQVRSSVIGWEGKSALLMTSVDASDEKALERKFAQAQKMEAVGKLAGGIAHDFNNILCGIAGHAEILRNQTGHADKEGVEAIVKAAHRASDLCNRLLDHSRPTVESAQVVDLCEIVDAARSFLEIGASGAVKTVYELADARVYAKLDSTGIERVLVNLVANAHDANVGASRVTIRVSRTETLPGEAGGGMWFGNPRPADDYAVLEVRDDGRGMNRERLRRIFDPFYTTKFEGRGLGLSGAYGIVTGHGGAIYVVSVPDVGTTFTAYFSGATSPPAQLPRPETTAAPIPRPQPSTVFVVDDEAMILAFAKTALEADGHRVITASSGEEAQALLVHHSGKVDAFLLDLSMPGMDGDELVRHIRVHRGDVPVVVMSGHGDDFVRDRMGNEPVAAILRKPFTIGELTDKLGEALSPVTHPT